MDAEVARAAPGSSDFEIELQLLLDAIYLKYHYDFRGYALASLKRRLRTALERFELRHAVAAAGSRAAGCDACSRRCSTC